jgi:hypothetical protein
MANDFAERIAVRAEAALKLQGLALVRLEVSESFDNGFAVFRSDQVSVCVSRDRGSVGIDFSPPGADESFDFEVLRRVIDGSVTYRAGMDRYGGHNSLPGKFPLLIATLSEYLPRIIQALHPRNVAQTRQSVALMQQDSLAFHFPNWKTKA